MGDRSEAVFEHWAKEHNVNFIRFGMDRPPFEQFKYLPASIRYLPDYLVEDTSSYIRSTHHKSLRGHCFIEVKACGHDQLIKIKQNSLDLNKRLEDFIKREVVFFIFDSKNSRVSFNMTNAQLTALIVKLAIPSKSFRDGTVYYPVPTSYFQWEPIDEPMGA